MQGKHLNGHLDATWQSFDALLDDTQRIRLVVQDAKAAQVRTFGEPASAGLWPFLQPGIEDGVAQRPDVHLKYNLVLELPPCVVINYGVAIMAR